jgi:3-dehydroquinate dehydratase
MNAASLDAESKEPCKAAFRVTTWLELGAALRVIDLFAQQGLCPEKVSIATRHDRLVISIHQPELTPHRADLIAARIGMQIDVIHVALKLNR